MIMLHLGLGWGQAWMAAYIDAEYTSLGSNLLSFEGDVWLGANLWLYKGDIYDIYEPSPFVYQDR